MKHVEIDLCFVREKVKNGQVLVNFVSVTDLKTYIMTKPLLANPFPPFRRTLWVWSVSEPNPDVLFNSVDVDASELSDIY